MKIINYINKYKTIICELNILFVIYKESEKRLRVYDFKNNLQKDPIPVYNKSTDYQEFYEIFENIHTLYGKGYDSSKNEKRKGTYLSFNKIYSKDSIKKHIPFIDKLHYENADKKYRPVIFLLNFLSDNDNLDNDIFVFYHELSHAVLEFLNIEINSYDNEEEIVNLSSLYLVEKNNIKNEYASSTEIKQLKYDINIEERSNIISKYIEDSKKEIPN